MAHACDLLVISRIQLDPQDLTEERQKIFEAQDMQQKSLKFTECGAVSKEPSSTLFSNYLCYHILENHFIPHGQG